ncbi:MAG: glycosyltransferase family 4 protein [Bacteroidota bacterium]
MPQHVIWVTPGFAADETDSRCIPPQQLLAKALLDAGVQLHVVSLHYPHQKKPYYWHGADVYPCHQTGFLAKVRTWLKAYHQIRILCKAYPDAILHSFWLNDACLLAQWVDRFRGRRHLVTLMGQDARPDNRYLRLLPLSSMYKVALSQFHAEAFQRSTGLEVEEIIPWGLPVQSINRGERPYHLLGIGNLIPLKRFEDFVQLVADMQASVPELRCLLVGEGPEKEYLIKRSKELGVQDSLELTGSIPRERVLQLLSQSRVLVHPSSYESFGFVLVEAIQQGAAVVARPVGIAPELESVQLANDREEFKQATITALQAPNEVSLVEYFQLEQIKTRYIQLYQRLSTENGN